MTLNTVEKKFCTTKEAATILGVSVGTIQLWVESGLLQAWKTTGGHRRVVRDSVQRLLHNAPDSGSPVAGVTLLAAVHPAHSLLHVVGHAPAPELPAIGARRLRVLVLEDDPDLLTLYKLKMGAWLMNPLVQGADNVVSALLAIGRQPPDLLIADMRMSDGMDSFTMLRQLRLAPETAQTTIVVVTGLAADAIRTRGGIPSEIEVLPKPVPVQRLQEIASRIARSFAARPPL